MYNFVPPKSNRNLPIHVGPAFQVYTTDDTVNYVFEGQGRFKPSLALVGSGPLTNSGTWSQYISQDIKHMCGTLQLNSHIHLRCRNCPTSFNIIHESDRCRYMPENECVTI